VKVIKRILLGLLSIAIVAGIGLTLLMKLEEHRSLKMISDGHITIDQEMHEWSICSDNSPVKITMYVRNSGNYKISGTLVFSATLSKKGLEEKFLREFIDCYGEERLKNEFKEEIAKKGTIGRLEAVNNYLLRGRQLPQGQSYEPTITEDKGYDFKIRKRLLIEPGQILKIDHEEQVPLNVRGYLLALKVETIEY